MRSEPSVNADPLAVAREVQSLALRVFIDFGPPGYEFALLDSGLGVWEFWVIAVSIVWWSVWAVAQVVGGTGGYCTYFCHS